MLKCRDDDGGEFRVCMGLTSGSAEDVDTHTQVFAGQMSRQGQHIAKMNRRNQ